MSSETDQIAELARITNAGSGTDTSTPPPQTKWTYHSATRSSTYAFLASLPLFVIYEVGILMANGGQMMSIRVGADIWLKRLLAWFGGTGWMALGVAVLIIGGVIYWAERNNRPPVVPRYFGLIIGESMIYAVVLAFIVGGVVGLLFGVWAVPEGMLQPMQRLGLPHQLALSIGAGLYEELVFRVILVGGLFLLVHRFLPKRTTAYIVAAVIGAFIFSLVHYTGPMGDSFQVSSFTFRFLFGLALNGVFLVRGFAVAAWTHALYDVFVVTGGFS
jgi:hypothetical protein